VVPVTGFQHTYRDPHGRVAHVRESADHSPGAYVEIPGECLAVPAHRLAEFTRALWAAAGQVVPDLPMIYDPATVDVMVGDLAKALPETEPALFLPVIAEALLNAGWRKP
jgi:hypothetical protein